MASQKFRVAHSSSGLGRVPLKDEIMGSNPICATNFPLVREEGTTHMNMINIVCPKCSAVAKLSLVDSNYIGPRRCWKCHEFFTITIVNNQVTSCEPLTQEEYERQQEAKKAAEKARGGIEFSGQDKTQNDIEFSGQNKAQGGIELSGREKPENIQKRPESIWDNIKTSSPKEPPRQKEPGKPSDIFPPDKLQTFIPLKDTNGEREKTPKTKKQDYSIPLNHNKSQTDPDKPTIFPPERIRTFVPLEDTDEEHKKP